MLCKATESYYMYGVTAIDNFFLREYMPKAPGDYVKVYLYCLAGLQSPEGAESIADIAAALGMETKAVEAAFGYWERLRFVEVSRSSDGAVTAVSFCSVKEALERRSSSRQEEQLYRYRDLNMSIDAIFGEQRHLTPRDYERIHDWTELLGLPEPVVLMLVQFCVKEKGSRVSINYIDTIAQDWAKQGINDIDRATELLTYREQSYRATKAILSRLGLRREPSVPEIELYKKWRDMWHFSPEAIELASNQLVATTNPSFKYLDAVLQRFYSDGLSDAAAIRASLEDKERLTAEVRDCLRIMGISLQRIPDEYISLYLKWTVTDGMERSVVQKCAAMLSRGSNNSFEYLNETLAGWHNKGINTLEAWQRYSEAIERCKSVSAKLMQALGASYAPDKNTLRVVGRWLKAGSSEELILKAAEYAGSTASPLQYIDKLLTSWRESGITTSEAAANEHSLRSANSQRQYKANTGKKDFRDYSQHSYTDADYDDLFFEQ